MLNILDMPKAMRERVPGRGEKVARSIASFVLVLIVFTACRVPGPSTLVTSERGCNDCSTIYEHDCAAGTVTVSGPAGTSYSHSASSTDSWDRVLGLGSLPAWKVQNSSGMKRSPAEVQPSGVEIAGTTP